MLESNSKLYYSIKEVSEMTELKPYVLRYWESEFPSLKPTKNKAGNRTYKKHDIQVILDIKVLLYEKKSFNICNFHYEKLSIKILFIK